jgi:hypothetical protein
MKKTSFKNPEIKNKIEEALYPVVYYIYRCITGRKDETYIDLFNTMLKSKSEFKLGVLIVFQAIIQGKIDKSHPALVALDKFLNHLSNQVMLGVILSTTKELIK